MFNFSQVSLSIENFELNLILPGGPVDACLSGIDSKIESFVTNILCQDEGLSLAFEPFANESSDLTLFSERIQPFIYGKLSEEGYLEVCKLDDDSISKITKIFVYTTPEVVNFFAKVDNPSKKSWEAAVLKAPFQKSYLAVYSHGKKLKNRNFFSNLKLKDWELIYKILDQKAVTCEELFQEGKDLSIRSYLKDIRQNILNQAEYIKSGRRKD